MPADARRALGIEPGQKVAIRQEGDVIVVDPAHDIAATRARLREQMERAGTWGKVPASPGGWEAQAEDRARGRASA